MFTLPETGDGIKEIGVSVQFCCYGRCWLWLPYSAPSLRCTIIAKHKHQNGNRTPLLEIATILVLNKTVRFTLYIQVDGKALTTLWYVSSHSHIIAIPNNTLQNQLNMLYSNIVVGMYRLVQSLASSTKESYINHF